MNLNYIRISIDYYDEEKFSEFRGIPNILNRLKNNIILLRKNNVKVGVGMTLMETVIFLMILGSMNKTEHAVKNTFLGLLVGAVSLFIVAIRNTAVLGRTQTIWTSTSFQAIRLINIGTVLTRMDFLIGIAQTILIFFKCSLFLYVSVVAISQLFGLKSYLPLVLPLAGIEVILAATVFQSPVDHAMITQNAGIIYSAPLVFFFPLLSLLIAKMRGLPKSVRSEET